MKDLRIGDPVPYQPEAAIYAAGPARWYALRTAPQRESQAELWLAQRGVYAFHPVLTRKVRRHGKILQVSRRYLPGYVFARFPGAAVLHRVLCGPFITGAIQTSAGDWGILKPEDLTALHAMRAVDQSTRQARQSERARQLALKALRRGDRALFRQGPLSGMMCEVAEIGGDGGVTVRLTIFGQDRTVVAHQQDLVPVRKAG